MMTAVAVPRTLTAASKSTGLFQATLYGGLSAGVLDASFAAAAYVLVLKAYTLPGVLQYIASGLIGQSAFSGGLPAAALGVGVHFVIAFVFSAGYGIAATRSTALTKNPIVLGSLYGALIWLFMSFAVLPVSGVPKQSFDLPLFLAFLADHMFFVGLPIALAAAKFIKK